MGPVPGAIPCPGTGRATPTSTASPSPSRLLPVIDTLRAPASWSFGQTFSGGQSH
ncbi:unnamed protein product [Musa acuminata subsp. malaccensis]|uniref:(wild Malaysian banana) hypothetical protein n=1 Tax=Musa acuminata subsp. malaccensis TaxID=214687 RepID=A0A804KXR0_MUSAM|nr:unnamed protein product [Musa acuminata subsp. malaccensis]